MKKTIISLTMLMLICIAFTGCKQADANGLFGIPPSTEITILYDVTEKMLARPNADIVKLFNFSNDNLYNGYEVRIQRISTVNLTPIFDAGIPPQNALLGDQMQRTGLVRSFMQQVQAHIDSLSQEKVIDEPYSVVYRTVTDELNNLSKSQAQTKICVLYSDMIENSSDFWGYSAAGKAEIRSSPQSVAAHLQKIEPLNNLKGIHIYVIYRPESYSSEIQADRFIDMYRIMWEGKGAVVSVGANLIPQ